MFCRQCGQSLVHDGMFCGNCGAPVPVEDREKMRKQASEAAGSDGTAEGTDGSSQFGAPDAADDSVSDGAAGESQEHGAEADASGKADAASGTRLVFGDAETITPPEMPKIDPETEAKESFERPVPERSAPPGWEHKDHKDDAKPSDRPPQYQPQPSVKSSYGGGYGGGTTGSGNSGGYGGGTRSYGWSNRSESSDAFTDTGEPRPIRPTSYLVPNIIVSILCCPMNILGIIGIIFSVLGNSRYDYGNYVDARNYAMVGMVLFWVTLGLGVLSWIGLGTFWGSLRYIF